ncbi:unnamed protein product [Danaus chrysippus]|uniref:(African queen) hypothetical protein n=1 Tax=Danaus chrysippus TaxID=151541 RepID=A0A8J2QKW0_9NEOP|nr:unnamed protein product [Danaus chrysippus]CAG9563836.1 unnamed protein product [Danaus chrysippus]CAG9563837.1 unnamed protein product [Danaus chrysippus]CAG9563838.1 unnamed protein product [Danaus chrysippus]
MKFLIVFAVCVAAASARFIVPDVAAAEAAEIKDIIAAINHPSTDPATAAALQQLLDSILNNQDSPIDVGPVIIDEDSPIDVGPVIIDEDSPIDVGPVIIDEDSPIDVGPVIIDDSSVGPSPSVSPLVQIIINVNSDANKPQPGPVIDDESDDHIPDQPVIIVDEPEIIEEPVVPEEVIVVPVDVNPIEVLPDTLN